MGRRSACLQAKQILYCYPLGRLNRLLLRVDSQPAFDLLQLRYCRLPVLAVELGQLVADTREIEVVDATYVDGVQLRSGPRTSEGMDPASCAEMMLCGSRPELVRTERFTAG